MRALLAALAVVAGNPHTPAELCGTGFRVLDRFDLSDARGRMGPFTGGRVDRGRSRYYAGPVYLKRRKGCVGWGGAMKVGRRQAVPTTVYGSNCSRR